MKTLEDICVQVRILVGACRDDISESKIEDVVQNYWTVSFPALIRTDERKGSFFFVCKKGISSYPFPEKYFDLNPPAFCEGYNLKVVYDSIVLTSLDHYWEQQILDKDPAATTIYSTILKYSPHIDSIVVFSDENSYTYDDPEVSYDPSSRELVVDLQFSSRPITSLQVKYAYVEENRPEYIFITPSKIELYPTPDADYLISLAGIKRPEPLPYKGVVSIPQEYIDVIIYGAALKLIAPIDMNYHNTLYPVFLDKKRLAMARTHHHLSFKLVQGI